MRQEDEVSSMTEMVGSLLVVGGPGSPEQLSLSVIIPASQEKRCSLAVVIGAELKFSGPVSQTGALLFDSPQPTSSASPVRQGLSPTEKVVPEPGPPTTRRLP